MESYKASITELPHADHFIACMMKHYDDGSDLAKKFSINKNTGITNGAFIQVCKSRWLQFNAQYEYTEQNVESWFGYKFCHVRIRSNSITFADLPSWSPNIVYVHEINR